jgi:predicted benzoate:H+ symporter BenE
MTGVLVIIFGVLAGMLTVADGTVPRPVVACFAALVLATAIARPLIRRAAELHRHRYEREVPGR